jgi:F-type H+-transporting ATPase subunit a
MDEMFPQVVFRIGGVSIYDTVSSTWVMMAIIALVAWLLGRRRPVALEMLVEFLAGIVSDMMGRPAAPYLSLLGTLCIFIAVANMIGVVPMMSTPTKDINTPIALALVVFFSVHYFGIHELGLRGYIKQLASPVFMLPLEAISQVSRTLSLSLRLFGNIISGEMIVGVIFSLVPLIAPLPLQIFTMFTGLLQAYIFTVLATVYVGAAVETNRNP